MISQEELEQWLDENCTAYCTYIAHPDRGGLCTVQSDRHTQHFPLTVAATVDMLVAIIKSDPKWLSGPQQQIWRRKEMRKQLPHWLPETDKEYEFEDEWE